MARADGMIPPGKAGSQAAFHFLLQVTKSLPSILLIVGEGALDSIFMLSSTQAEIASEARPAHQEKALSPVLCMAAVAFDGITCAILE